MISLVHYQKEQYDLLPVLCRRHPVDPQNYLPQPSLRFHTIPRSSTCVFNNTSNSFTSFFLSSSYPFSNPMSLLSLKAEHLRNGRKSNTSRIDIVIHRGFLSLTNRFLKHHSNLLLQNQIGNTTQRKKFATLTQREPSPPLVLDIPP